MADSWSDADCLLAPDFFDFRTVTYQTAEAYDCFVYQKISVSQESIEFARMIRAAGKHLVWDICDPIWWWMPAEQFLALAKYVSAFVVISRGLQEDLKTDMQIDSVVIPDRLPYREKCKAHEYVKDPVLLWYGHSANRIPCLYGMGIVWNRLAIDGIECRIRIMDEHPQALQIKATPNYEHLMEYEQYDYRTEHEDVMKADVACLPPYPPPWGLMKGEIKRTVASWAGLPYTDGNDYPELKQLLSDWRLRKDIGAENRMLAEDSYEIQRSVDQYKVLINMLDRREYEPLGSLSRQEAGSN